MRLKFHPELSSHVSITWVIIVEKRGIYITLIIHSHHMWSKFAEVPFICTTF